MMGTGSMATGTPIFAPSAVMYTNDECQVIKVALPEVSRDSIVVTADHDELVVSGAGRDRQYYRRLPLRYHARREQIETTVHDDVLEIHVPNPRYGQRELPSSQP